MNANAIARRYDTLTPEERFRLIMAASGRGDEAEKERLARAGRDIRLVVADHQPYAQAFLDLARLRFMELIEEAGCYYDALDRATDLHDLSEDEAARGRGAGKTAAVPASPPAQGSTDKHPAWKRALEIAFATGFVLRTKVDGWKLFCERLNVPCLLCWECLPGHDRLQRVLTATEIAAFGPEDFLDWLNRTRQPGMSELTVCPLTAESVADANRVYYQSRAAWWGAGPVQ